MMISVIGIIPARYWSTRLEGKLLQDIHGKSVLERTWRNACRAATLDRVVIAAGDDMIARAARDFGADVVEVYSDLPNGTDRTARAVRLLFPAGSKPKIVVNIQGDEPLLDPETVDAVVRRLLEDKTAGVATAVAPISSEEEYRDPGVVKVVTDVFGRALYFSRSPIPHGVLKSENTAFRHIGLYAFRRKVLEEFVALEPCDLEEIEKLEQLRLLYNGISIATVVVEDKSIGVDTTEDLEKAKKIVESLHPGRDTDH